MQAKLVLPSRIRPIVSFPKRNESYYQKIVEEVLQGKHKVLQSGITDVTNADTHAEIKQWKKYKYLVGQLLSYNMYDNKPNLQAYMFGDYLPAKKKVALKVFNYYNIHPFEFVPDYRTNKMLLIDINRNKVILKSEL
jgi:hypothetical protein